MNLNYTSQDAGKNQSSSSEALINIKNLTKHYPVQRGFWSKTVGLVRALNNVNLKIKEGQIIGVVGESGCGKSTLAKLILRLIEPTQGKIEYRGKDIFLIPNNEFRKLRQKLQIIFQNPYSSLNPRMKVFDIISEPITVHKLVTNKFKLNEKVDGFLNLVGLEALIRNKYPHELSGGQRQRVAIARALSLNPEFLVLDEAVSALDVSIQAQILNLLLDLQKKLCLTYLFISHNLSVISYISSHIAVMYLGNIVEFGQKDDIIKNPLHPYTIALLNAAPKIEIRDQKLDTRKEKRIILSGEVPDPSNPPSGCSFRTRCPIAKEKCALETPAFTLNGNQYVSCHYTGELRYKS